MRVATPAFNDEYYIDEGGQPIFSNWCIRLERVLGTENQRAHFARCAASTIHHAQVVSGDLTLSSLPHYLASAFDDMAEPSRQSRLTSR